MERRRREISFADSLCAPLFAKVARPLLRLQPIWMDMEDMMQDGRVAVLEGRKIEWGMLDGVRRSKRVVPRANSAVLSRHRGWDVSYDDWIIEGEDHGVMSWLDTLADDRTADPAWRAMQQELHRRFWEMIALLPIRKQHIARLFYAEEWTKDAIGKQFGLTTGRITQLVQEIEAALAVLFSA